MSFHKYIIGKLMITFSIIVHGQSLYKTNTDTLCDGFPRIAVTSMAQTCLGLVADAGLKDERTGETFRFPRKIVELTPKRFLVLDMGGWSPPDRGGLWELDLQKATPRLWNLVKGLQLPHGLAWGPDGNLYIGEAHRIVRFSRESLLNRQTLQAEVVVDNLVRTKARNLHPLINFTFGKGPRDRGDLYVNIGAPSDNCVEEAPNKCSVESEHGLIRRYFYRSEVNQWDPRFEVLATGLRNSMGLVSHPSGHLLQAENSRDFKEQNEPYDELNLILPGRHYGWPYCYNFQATSPEWTESVNCRLGFEKPLVLLAPHAAPLDLIYYNGDLFPEWKGHLLMSWHGHQPTGSRIVAYPTNAQGLPVVEKNVSWSYSFHDSKQLANPQGGNLQSAPYMEIVSGWKKIDGVRPSGSPVGLLVASDGSLFIVEDKNKTILRLSRSHGPNSPSENLDANDSSNELLKKVKVHRALKSLQSDPDLLSAYNWINQNVFQTNCNQCHGGLQGSGIEAFEFMISEGWITPASSESLLLQRLKGLNGLQKMPMGSELPDKTIQYIETWIQAL